VLDNKSNWRRGGDSNPRYPLRYVRFRGGSFQPLTHLSAPDNIQISIAQIAADSEAAIGQPTTNNLPRAAF
jgi:hypothetical protein